MTAIKEIYDAVCSNNWYKLTSLEKDDLLKSLKNRPVSISGKIIDVLKGYPDFIILVESLTYKTGYIYERTRSIYEEGPAIEYQRDTRTKQFTFECTTSNEEIARQSIVLKNKNIEIDGTIISVTPPSYPKEFTCKIKIKQIIEVEKIWMTQDFFEIPHSDKSVIEYEKKKKLEEEQAKKLNAPGCLDILQFMRFVFVTSLVLWVLFKACKK